MEKDVPTFHEISECDIRIAASPETGINLSKRLCEPQYSSLNKTRRSLSRKLKWGMDNQLNPIPVQTGTIIAAEGTSQTGMPWKEHKSCLL